MNYTCEQPRKLGETKRQVRMPERSKNWIKQAERDLETAEELIKDGSFEWSCFVAQQAAGKAVKAVFQKLNAIAWDTRYLTS